MGLFSGVAALFHSRIDEEARGKIRNEINLAEAVDAHIAWKVRLQKYMDGKSEEQLDPMVICRDDQCTLGKWIHGPAMNHFHEFEPFHKLRADHAQFHYVAANVVKHVQANESAAADTLFKGEYQHVSHSVVMALTELNQLINE